jgi:hypothetical protein
MRYVCGWSWPDRIVSGHADLFGNELMYPDEPVAIDGPNGITLSGTATRPASPGAACPKVAPYRAFTDRNSRTFSRSSCGKVLSK